jgi:methylthioribose-1-phosphate isomerase
VRLYVALPSPTIDWRVRDALRDIPIEERSGIEVTHVQGRDAAGAVVQVQISPDATPGANAAFDVTPARLVAGLITECGIVPATAEGLAAAFPYLMEDAA